MASNMTGEVITGVYDYGNMVDSDKMNREIIDLMRNRGEVDYNQYIDEELKQDLNWLKRSMKNLKTLYRGLINKR